MRLLLVHNSVPPGAPPDEADVLVQAAAVQAALEHRGHNVERYACGLDLRGLEEAVDSASPDLVFNLVESLGGHGRLIHLVPDVLEAVGVPYAGCPADAIHLTSHKALAKRLMQDAGLPTPPWVTGGPFAGNDERRGRWIIKSVWEDASLGLDDDALVDGDPDEVSALIDARAGTPGSPWFAEAFVEGREFNLAILDGPQGPRVLPPAEMLFQDYPEGKPRIVGYAAKWDEDSFEYSHTVRTFDFPAADGPLLTELSRLALACWVLFGMRGWARVDFRVDAGGRPWILEANANPCLAPDAGYAAALDRAGIPFHEAVEGIVASAR
ncbi:MAG: D-alanine--D-alanine ligase [bacterium]